MIGWFKEIVSGVSILLVLLPAFALSQQTASLESTVWLLKPKNKKEKAQPVVLFFLKNNEACVMFQDLKAGVFGFLPVRTGKRPVWKQKGSEYSIKFRDRDMGIYGKIAGDNSITGAARGDDSLLGSESGFIGEPLKDPKLAYNTRNVLVPLAWLTVLPGGKPKWAAEIKAQGADLCNPLEDANKWSPWFPSS